MGKEAERMRFKGQKAKILLFGDLHIGNQYCDMEYIIKCIQRVKKMNNTYVYEQLREKYLGETNE